MQVTQTTKVSSNSLILIRIATSIKKPLGFQQMQVRLIDRITLTGLARPHASARVRDNQRGTLIPRHNTNSNLPNDMSETLE